METGTLVTFGYVWQAVCRFNLKYSENIHFRIVTAADVRRNPRQVSVLAQKNNTVPVLSKNDIKSVWLILLTSQHSLFPSRCHEKPNSHKHSS
jgi:hypothetical protein